MSASKKIQDSPPLTQVSFWHERLDPTIPFSPPANLRLSIKIPQEPRGYRKVMLFQGTAAYLRKECRSVKGFAPPAIENNETIIVTRGINWERDEKGRREMTPVTSDDLETLNKAYVTLRKTVEGHPNFVEQERFTALHGSTHSFRIFTKTNSYFQMSGSLEKTINSMKDEYQSLGEEVIFFFPEGGLNGVNPENFSIRNTERQ